MYLYGASGHARVIMDSLKASGIDVDAFVDDNPLLKEVNGVVVKHQSQGLSPFIVSIGANEARKKVVEKLRSGGATFGKAVHPSAVISPSVTIDEGSVIMAGALINASTQIGKHCIINTGACIDHECLIDDFVHISPHATLCGNTVVGEGTWVGAGAVIKQGIKIGRWCVIGAGAVVIKNVPDKAVMAGVPAKVLRIKEL